jgi:predicted nucleic acid-binding protein
MPNSPVIVINTSPLIALIAALGSLDILDSLYEKVVVPLAVCEEILKGGKQDFAVSEFQKAKWLSKENQPIQISQFLLNSLDLGEASVIQVALNQEIKTVCIDETVGRRVARLNGLKVTGSIGILLKYKQQEPSLSIQKAIQNMISHNIYLSQNVINLALKEAGEL